MKDDKIIALFFQRDEHAISEVQKHYGAGCYGIAKKFLDLPEDCEEWWARGRSPSIEANTRHRHSGPWRALTMY